MKKILSLALATVMSLSAFATLAACGGDDGTKKDGENTAPVITGVKEEAMVFAGEEYDALAGVTATDAEDGDLTSKIEVSASGLTFTNGKVTPTESAEYTGYEIAYTVKDSGGEETTEYGTLYVYEEAEALQKKFTADFTTPTLPRDDGDNKPYSDKVMHWWGLDVKTGATATKSNEKGALVINVENGGENPTDVVLQRGFGEYEAGTYRVVAWVDISAATKIGAQITSQGNTYEAEDVNVAAGYQKLEWKITATTNDLLFKLLLGGGEGRAAAYTLSVLKLAIFQVIGTGEDVELFNRTFTDNAGGITGNDHAIVTFDDTKKETHVAVSYNENTTDDGYARATIALGNYAVTKGTQYKLTLTLKATAALKVNVCVEDDAQEWKVRAFFETVEAAANEEKTVTLSLDWHDGNWQTVESGNAVIRLYFGLHTEAQNNGTNDVIVKNVKLIQPGQVTRKAQDNFMLFGWGSAFENDANKTYPYNVFNGSDDANPRAGVSAMYVEDGKLVYRIYEGATIQGDNNLQIGFGNEYVDNLLHLPGNAYYVVTFTIKSSVELDFNLTLHDNTFEGDSWDLGLIMRYADFEGTALHVGPTEQTFTLISHVVNADTKCALLFEFGSEKLAALTGGAVIEISELSIGYRTIKTAAAD